MPQKRALIKAEIKTLNQLIARNVKHYRQFKGLTQLQTAELLGCTIQQVQKYENNVNRISTARLIILARAFNLPLHQFYTKPISPLTPENTPVLLGECLSHLTSQKRQLLLNLAQELIYV